MRCLIVKSNMALAEKCRAACAERDIETEIAASAAEARSLLDRVRFDVVLTASRLSDGTGEAVARAAARRQPGARVIVLGGVKDQICAAIGTGACAHCTVFRPHADPAAVAHYIDTLPELIQSA
ncbi:hypothetical protein LNKW23_04620 [Paralimibaculum aggregatum]|uniref:Response regulatory domain-containing protein n=1 Tax=Paralimibaculum aggregatum TaxID=3036245 RepID=A0ABQ6LGQ5_9RHOB|nr:hypothetical protein [Limibaculum sp. NKW23]GMG81249.1 hypothetical protein LNKW23_04620 [Limibaculum sp. NKW23]